ncbi:MAG TPA: type II CAAX endopeptidase family protein [Candidatus Aquilonibacter sp.]|nr:type II CAAX endopeptidase family protein [Candidatus Aquilonibacter sp.]
MTSKRSLTVLLIGWLLCVCFMLVRGRADIVTIGTDIVWPLVVLLCAWVTTRIAPAPEPLARPTDARPRIILQLVVIGIFIILTGLRGAQGHGLMTVWIPGWSPLLAFFASLGSHIGMASDVTNFGSYVVVPGILVMLLGARLGEIGFARFGPNIGRLSALWLAFPAVLWAIAIARGVSPGFMIFALIRNVLSNGISEEFLWRGLLFTRLRALVSTETALWTQAVLFGLWHFGYDYSSAPHHDLALMVADMFSSQVVLGYAFAWLMLRTRNIVLPTAVHAAFDSLGDAFGAT